MTKLGRIPCVWEGSRHYRFHKLTWLPEQDWIRLERGVPLEFTFNLDREVRLIDAIPLLLETPKSPLFKGWIVINGNVVARVGEYGALEIVGDEPQYLRKGDNDLEINPIGWGWLRSIMLYETEK